MTEKDIKMVFQHIWDNKTFYKIMLMNDDFVDTSNKRKGFKFFDKETNLLKY